MKVKTNVKAGEGGTFQAQAGGGKALNARTSRASPGKNANSTVLLKSLSYPGYFPDNLDGLPPEIKEFIAKQLNPL